MQNRVPVLRAERPALPDFTPVPRKTNRHDGWTPARQKAFIEALADTGSVRRAAAMVNMSQANAYALRRAPGAEEFRAAWDAALDFGLKRLKDLAFERAVEGELIPVFQGGKLMGFRRKRNDALLMFCLRHYGQDASGKRTTINYFSSRASASAGAAGSEAQASTTTVRTVLTGDGGGDGEAIEAQAVAALENFQGVTLDAEAEAAIAEVLAANAERQRVAEAILDQGGDAAADVLEEDPEADFIRLPHNGRWYRGELVSGVELIEDEWQDVPDDEDGEDGEDAGDAGDAGARAFFPPCADG